MKKFQCIDKNDIIFSMGNGLYRKNFELIVKIKNILPDTFSLPKRFLRNDIHKVKIAGNIFIVVVKGKIFFFKNKSKISEITIDRGSRPLRQGIEVINEIMYYGDYWHNEKRERVNIYQIDLRTFKKEIHYTFSHIRHIHFVQKDIINENCLLIGTGDRDEESGLYKLDTITKNITIIAEGSQKYRAVSILQIGNKLFWGSDDPDGDNYIYALHRVSNELEPLCRIDGPAYYSTINSKGDMFIATTIEDRTRHKSIIYKSNDGGQNWRIFKEFKKDIWHAKYFGYGTIEFIDGQGKYEELIYNLLGLKEIK